MNARELADALGVHAETIRRQIRSGKIEATKVGRDYKIPKHESDRLLKHAEEVDFDKDTKRIAQWMKFSIDEQIESHLNEINKIQATGGEMTDVDLTLMVEHAKKIAKLENDKEMINPKTFKMEIDDDE